jgi:hypothetical protein
MIEPVVSVKRGLALTGDKGSEPRSIVVTTLGDGEADANTVPRKAPHHDFAFGQRRGSYDAQMP